MFLYPRSLVKVMEENIPAALRQLSACLVKLRELLAWYHLKAAERRDNGLRTFRFNDHLSEDIRNEYSSFLATAVAIQDALDQRDDTVSVKRRHRWQQRLDQLQRQLAELTGIERFISIR